MEVIVPWLEAMGAGGLYIWAFLQTPDRIHARFFGGSLGIVEDPATGSAASGVSAYLLVKDRIPVHKTLTIFQGREMGRPSTIRVRFSGGSDEPFWIGGRVVPVMSGMLDG